MEGGDETGFEWFPDALPPKNTPEVVNRVFRLMWSGRGY